VNRHSNRKQKAAWAALVTAAALCLALAPAASALDVADVRAGAGGLDFVPQVEHGGFVLTVSGPDGFHHRAEFGTGQSPSFSIFDHGGGVLSVYAHLSALLAGEGDEVLRGQTLGKIGETGSLRGPYLYFELRVDGAPVDPAGWLAPR